MRKLSELLQPAVGYSLDHADNIVRKYCVEFKDCDEVVKDASSEAIIAAVRDLEKELEETQAGQLYILEIEKQLRRDLALTLGSLNALMILVGTTNVVNGSDESQKGK